MENFQIKNYKCFDDDGCTITSFKDINIIIGKNNSGKSSIIDIVKFLTGGDKKFFENLREGKSPQFFAEHAITEKLIRTVFSSSTYGGELYQWANHQEYGLQFVGKTIEYEITQSGNTFIHLRDYNNLPGVTINYFKSYVAHIPNSLGNKNFVHLTAERDVQPERPEQEIQILPNGVGATNFIQQIINRSDLDSALIEKKLLEELNKITNPDIHFTRILVQLNGNHWEIYFENKIDGRIPLSKMGSGIKTILLVLLLIVVQPEIQKRQISNHVFALEELENNLHPSQQRRLYYYLYEYCVENNCKFFFTTHSNIVIDLFNKLENTQILHINRSEDQTNIKSINQFSELNHILDDLDIKASDILQSNSIIWVEGPSDRLYINKWIKLIDSNLIEGYHYSIMFYGGRLLSNLTLDYESVADELIPLIKLNRNSYVVMDRDGKTISVKLNKTKERIAKELGENRIWITKGREIENYLNDRTLNSWLKNNHSFGSQISNDANTKLEVTIESADPQNKISYNLNKNKFASEIANFIDESDLNILDLKSKIEDLVSLIKRWNKQ
jgi:putative ATP-dependent endonuclease of OLD family